MNELFVCPHCHSSHDEPAHPHLGHRLACGPCALEEDVADWAAAPTIDPELIAA